MKKIFALILIVFFLAACASVQPTSAAVDEYEFYSSFLRQVAGEPGELVIMDTTGGDMITMDAEYAAYLKENLPDAPAALVDAFVSANATPVALEAKFDLPSQVTLASSAEITDLFSSSVEGGWDAFYKAHPDASGIITLSRPAFSADGTQALIYMGQQSAPLAGAGFIYYLEKVDGEWQVKSEVMTWIS